MEVDMLKYMILLITIFLLLCGISRAVPGDTLKSIPSPGLCPLGLTFDGQSLWNVDRRTDMLYKIDITNGSILDSITSPGYMPLGLTYDGKLLWTEDSEEERIYAINPHTKIVEKTIYCPVSQPSGLAWDGSYLWIADDSDNKLHQISPEDGTTIKTIPAPSGNPCGLTFDGTYLWVSDRYANMIYMVTPETGDVVICFQSPGPYSWGLAYDGTNLWNVDYQNGKVYQLVNDDNTLFSRLEEKHQQVEIIHQVRNFGPDEIKELDVYLAIPVNMNNQVLEGEIIYNPEPENILIDKWGQKVAHFKFYDISSGNNSDVSMFVTAKLYQTRYYIFPEKVGKISEIPKDTTLKYLVDDSKYSIYDPIIQKGVKEAIGDEKNPYWIGRKIYNYIIEHIEYELAGGWNLAPTVLERGNGSCSEYSFVYIAMCRAAGLPARYAGSVVVRGDDASWDDVYHRWVEIFLPNYGWIPVDPSGGDSPSPSHRANYFGFLNNRYLITTSGGGGSEYLEWSYNANERWQSVGKCKIVVENFAEWRPVTK